MTDTSAASREPLLRVEDLVVSYGRGASRVRALDGVSLSIERGSTTAIIGESGCGKSTFAKAICGLIPAESGTMTFNGHQLGVGRDPARRAGELGIQTVQQDPAAGMDPRWPIWRIVAESRARFGESVATRRERAVAALEEVAIGSHMADRRPAELSGGQRQRVTIARAIAADPTMIILDEAVSALDVSVRNEVLGLLQRLKETRDLTYIFITHDVSVVTQCATDVGVFYLGTLMESGTVGDVLVDQHHPYTRALLSAIPTLDTRISDRLRMEGDLPSLANPPAGCRFNTRCPYKVEACETTVPVLVERAPGHLSACHRVEEIVTLSR